METWLIEQAKGHQILASKNWYEIPDISSNYGVTTIYKYGD